MKDSLYWDDFKRRINETRKSLSNGELPPIRRVAVYVTNKCNFKCGYCNMRFDKHIMDQEYFKSICKKHGKDAIIHITGGEPSVVPWLYNFIDNEKSGIRFHLNTNALIKPPKNIKRLKASLDTMDKNKFKKITGVDGFNRVIDNIKNATKSTLVSITYVLSKQTYLDAPKFMEFARNNFPKLYAVFFSIYKGNDRTWVMDKNDVNIFFNETIEKLESAMDKESLWLFKNTIDEKRRILQGIRFPENKEGICYLSMSEKVYDYNKKESNCSHLYRDGICRNTFEKVDKCQYGCNRKLVMFNQAI